MKKIINLSKSQINNIEKLMPKEKNLQKLANFFDLLSDATRVKIITALCMQSMCVNDLSKTLNINQTTLSHQLKHLKSNNAVISHRDGKIVYYKMNNNCIYKTLLTGVDYLIAN